MIRIPVLCPYCHSDQIIKGGKSKAAELPVEQPVKFELVITLKTAQALWITLSPTLLFLADEVIK